MLGWTQGRNRRMKGPAVSVEQVIEALPGPFQMGDEIILCPGPNVAVGAQELCMDRVAVGPGFRPHDGVAGSAERFDSENS